jgi:5-hydroxyisourate hydrolase-like protein (transthyretin family)
LLLTSAASIDSWFLTLPLGRLAAAVPATTIYELLPQAYPCALPNDGYSESDIAVAVSADGQPAAGVTVLAEVVGGGGSLTVRTAQTDREGVAHFPYRAGLMPAPSQLRFRVQDAAPALPGVPASDASLTIPLAPVTYLDVQLVTPEEYERMKELRNKAAAIYTLGLRAFPQQLAADGGSMTTVNCELKTVMGKPAAGVALTAKLVSGDGQLIPDGKVTDGQGRFYIDFIAGLTPGLAVIRVTEPSSGLSQDIEITLVKAGPARIKLANAAPQSIIATREGTFLPTDGQSSLALVAEVTDLAGIPLSGVELRIEIMGDATNGRIDILDAVSDAQGRVEFEYFSGNQPGKVRIRAYAAAGLEELPGWSR